MDRTVTTAAWASKGSVSCAATVRISTYAPAATGAKQQITPNSTSSLSSTTGSRVIPSRRLNASSAKCWTRSYIRRRAVQKYFLVQIVMCQHNHPNWQRGSAENFQWENRSVNHQFRKSLKKIRLNSSSCCHHPWFRMCKLMKRTKIPAMSY